MWFDGPSFTSGSPSLGIQESSKCSRTFCRAKVFWSLGTSIPSMPTPSLSACAAAQARGLPRENRGGITRTMSRIPLAASAAPRGEQVIISFAHEQCGRGFIEKIAVLKIVHSRNAIRKVAVYVGYFQRVIAVYAPRGAVLAHARQGNHLPGAPVVLLLDDEQQLAVIK